ncbi:ArsB/NhaD family transporter, partial [Pantoea agglomerans]|uniref:ArsB/NhaD family transporter n=1 Tax=Enterobacter agglomerans TaxID=549 RepID=UPI003EEE9E46
LGDIPSIYDVSLLKSPGIAIKYPATFRSCCIVLLFLLVGFFVLEPMGIPVIAIAPVAAQLLLMEAKTRKSLNTRKFLSGEPCNIV